MHFLNIALGSATETEYLIEVAHRLDTMFEAMFKDLAAGYKQAVMGLQRLVASYDGVA